jgi:predicted DNA-binding protein (MmcQ/YjbR family)
MAPAVRPFEGELPLAPAAAALKARLNAKRGATVEGVFAPRGTRPLSLAYKVGGKTFAILSARKDAFVMLKADPHLVEILRGQYAGVGRRTHLDPRHWICVSLDADVPQTEVHRLADGSYDLVRAGLTKKQQAQLAGVVT